MLLCACAVLTLSGLALAGCATPPPASDPEAQSEFKANNDPLEPTNRVIYAISDKLDTYILAPIARAYVFVLPNPVRRGVHNVLANISSPALLGNDMLQGKPRHAGDTFVRFLINSTAGVGGLFDVAAQAGYPSHDTDFGITLALWGVPNGPYLFLPVLGPSSPRDAAGFGGNVALDPLTFVTGGGWTVLSYARFGVGAVDARSEHLDDIKQIKEGALDPYATFRSLYQQSRAAQIEQSHKDGPHTVPDWFTAPAAAQ
jgi:phospholipid-binding lipoprotein MlaA